MPRPKKVKQVTVPELQAFLNGAMEFNPDDWVPDAAQWKRIVGMIMNLKPEEQIVVQNNSVRNLPRAVERHMDSNMGDVDPTEVNSSLTSTAPRTDMRIANTETIHSISEGKDENGVISSGKKFKGKARDDSKGMGPSDFE